MFYSLSVLATKNQCYNSRKLLLISESRERLESFMMDITGDTAVYISSEKNRMNSKADTYPYFVIEKFHKVI